MLSDLRVALRALAARPVWSVLGVLTLALGIGATAAVFSLLDALYFRPLPLREPERLVRITQPSANTVFGLLSHPECEELRAATTAFTDVVPVGGRGVTLRQEGEARMLIVKYVSPSFFDTLGIRVARGRGFRPEDERSDSPLVVINHQLWQQRLLASADIVGEQIQLNDSLFTVIGVTPPRFLGLDRTVRTDVWVLAQHARFAVPGLGDEVADRSSRWFEAFARLAPGTTLGQARAQLERVSQRWTSEDARAYAGAPLQVADFLDDYHQGVREGAAFLGLLGLVLLIASANAANLTLARSEGRRRELAVRAALGASRSRLVRQLGLESLLLCLAGTLAGLALAFALMQALPAFVPADGHSALDVRFDVRLLAFVALLLAFTTVLVATVPAWRHSRPDLGSDLKQAFAGAARAGRGFGARDLIVVAQMGVSVIVLIAAGLLLRSLQYGERLNPGFDPAKHVATFYTVPALRGYDLDATRRFFEDARRQVAALPGVKRASYAIRLPAQGNEAGWAADFLVPGREPPAGEDAFHIRFDIVGPDYFEVLGARLLRGRGFRESDGVRGAAVAVINQTMAERLWPGEDPVGKRIVMGRSTRVEREIVGVAENGKIASLYEAPEMYVFVPFAQQGQGFGLLLAETAAPPDASLMTAVRRAIATIDRDLPILDVSTLERHRSSLLAEERRDALVAGAAGLLALALGSVGVYGVVSLVTLRRTKEIGIRIALGARRGDVLRLVLGSGARLALAGCVLGGLAGLAATRLLASRLHGVSSTDARSFALGASCLLVAALLAGALPALRAVRIDPAASIREE
jgi:predicted permease